MYNYTVPSRRIETIFNKRFRNIVFWQNKIPKVFYIEQYNRI